MSYNFFLFHVNLKRCISLTFAQPLYTKDISYRIGISTKHTVLIACINQL